MFTCTTFPLSVMSFLVFLLHADTNLWLQQGTVPQHVRGAAQVTGYRRSLVDGANWRDAQPGAAHHYEHIQQGSLSR